MTTRPTRFVLNSPHPILAQPLREKKRSPAKEEEEETRTHHKEVVFSNIGDPKHLRFSLQLLLKPTPPPPRPNGPSPAPKQACALSAALGSRAQAHVGLQRHLPGPLGRGHLRHGGGKKLQPRMRLDAGHRGNPGHVFGCFFVLFLGGGKGGEGWGASAIRISDWMWGAGGVVKFLGSQWLKTEKGAGSKSAAPN